MNTEVMKESIEILKKLKSEIDKLDYKEDTSGRYANPEKEVCENIKNQVANVRDKLLIPLANDCFLVENKIDGHKYGINKMNTSDYLKDYIWTPLMGNMIVVGNYISFKNKDGVKTDYPMFYNGVDIEEKARMSNTGEKEAFLEKAKNLKEKLDAVKNNNKFFECLQFTLDECKPIIKIDLKKYVVSDAEEGELKKGYQDLVQEYTNAIVKIKALYNYIIVEDENEKEKVWKKVEWLFKSLYVSEQKRFQLSPTVLKINDLIFEDCKQMVLTGAPGTGKTYSAKDFVKWQIRTDNSEVDEKEFDSEWKKGDKGNYGSRWAMVQFHPSFDYSDFVEGIRPAKVQGDDKMPFVRMDGVFKKFCRNVIEKGDKNKNYYFIIDEINRADLSKVFGELMYCLEENYRGEENKIQTQYSNLDTYEMKKGVAIPLKERNDKDKAKDVFEDGFYIPSNVILIGTMNDIDRSVDTFDFALRRRFRWVNVGVDTTLLTSTFRSMNSKANTKKSDDEITAFVQKIMNMNDVFEEPEYSKIFRTPKDYYVGPAYFEGLFKGQSMETIWNNKVEPLLKEYIRGRNAGDFISDTKGKLLPEKDDSKKEVLEGGIIPVVKSLNKYELIVSVNKFLQSEGSDLFLDNKKKGFFSSKGRDFKEEYTTDIEKLADYLVEKKVIKDKEEFVNRFNDYNATDQAEVVDED
ncbi:MAG: AAA family ATPase [Eubacterium sp.]|nr:AAA family ATPase [Eubacterium sp.]